MRRERIYLSPPHMSGLELDLIKDALQSNWIAPLGPHVNAFEKEFASYHNIQYATAVSTGTAALHLVLRVLGIKEGDRVFCPTFTFCASATPIIYLGAEPVFIDSESRSWNMDPELFSEALVKSEKSGNLPKAIIAVHLYGQSVNMDPVLDSCLKYRIPVIEDAAEALGAQYKGKPVGTLGTAGIFSFNGNKIITTSSGGMIISKDKAIIDKAHYYATQARDPVPHYQHSEIGYNYRMSNILAAIGRAQLKVLDDRVEKARQIFRFYRNKLKVLHGISLMPEPDWSHGSRWLTCIIVDPKRFGATREDIRIALETENIESRPVWKPMHLQPVFEKYEIIGGRISEELFEWGLCLPSGTDLDEEELEIICRIIQGTSRSKTVSS